MASPVPHRVARRLLGIAAMFVSLAMAPVAHMALAADGLSANAQDDAQRSVVNVVNVGADPQGVKDSAQAVKSAIAEAKTLSDAGTPSRLVFPQGTCQLYPESAEVRELYVSNTVGADRRYKDKTIAILLEGVSDVIVDGQGSHFQLHGQQTTLAAIDSSNVQMQNCSTDWTTPRVVDITIVGKRTNEDGTQ
ncbi:MAG: hypothetical protein SO360_00755 [Bifidobacterium tsurumiense]|uniref:hypothetical protein n=1 Tax=Bifidobacterium tsurumiense TaxID=356829 RepID=UPI002A8086C2|nr:hypothetical protein [Bifidobacterium tsurumiense]MDY4677383.1 hypothetical protein [Bifidobacterium tsurumiense]